MTGVKPVSVTLLTLLEIKGSMQSSDADPGKMFFDNTEKRRMRGLLTRGVRGHATVERGFRVFQTGYWPGFKIKVWKIHFNF